MLTLSDFGDPGARRETTRRLDSSGEVAGVVNAMDGGKFAPVPLDFVNAGGAKIQPVKGSERDAESAAQQDLYRGDVTYHQDVVPGVVQQ
jgi:hypothetical protein